MSRVVHVLLVEDNQSDALLVRRRLELAQQINCEIQHAEWLSSALMLAKNKYFDIVLLDLSLPDSHGVDTIVSIRRELPTTPVIVLSAQEDISVAERSMKAGADTFIVKQPTITTNELEREILYSLERNRRQTMSKSLMQRSVENLVVDSGKATTAANGLASAHITQIDDTIEHVRTFLQRNNPAIAEQVEQILNSRGYHIVMQELRGMLRSEDTSIHKRKTVPLSERALSALREVTSSVTPTPDPEAELEDVLKRLGPAHG